MFEELDEAALIERIGELERVKSAAAGDQAKASAALDAKRRDAQAARAVPAARRGRGLGAEIGLARHDSPKRGREHLAFAITLVQDMPHTLAALESGILSEWRAALIVTEAAGLSPADRRALDVELCSAPRDWPDWATSGSPSRPVRSPTASTPEPPPTAPPEHPTSVA